MRMRSGHLAVQLISSAPHTGEPIIYEADFVNWGTGMLKRGGHITILTINDVPSRLRLIVV